MSARLVISHEETGRTTLGFRRSVSTFLESSLDPGTYHLAAFAADGRVGVLADITLAEGQSLVDLKILFRQGATLRVSHTNDQLSTGCDLFLDGHVIAMELLSPGIPAVVTVPAGEITLKVRNGKNVTVERVIHCSPGDDLEVVFDDL